MHLTGQEFIWVIFGFFIIATLYASVGFGGGSSYLAILALVFTGFFAIRSTALLCNLVVVSGSCYLYFRRGHLYFRKFLPFIVTSIPLAFIGASFKLKENVFFIILGAALIASAVALVVQSFKSAARIKLKRGYPVYMSYVLGGVIGLLSGLVGIGGGIFLAPVLNHMRWETPVKIAALASFFILVNSVAGLGGLWSSGTFEVPWSIALGLLLAVFLGGQLGLRLSLDKLTGNGIRLITALLVFIVGARVLVSNGLQISFVQ
ncbi:sulfite exporter TauE/SafE family protein [Spongiimicrobium sp. 2-473A-2-J]|uniref:sulfite exporter TauE/SafE family protein n=1 Tax=Eudoraea algarum TaxID=3417568 RepID=UPI003D35DE5D